MAGTIAGQIEDHGEVAVEYKYDGSRFQFHKMGNICRIYSRRLEEVTGSLPDIVMHLGEATDHDVILDGEVVAVQDGRPMPFQYVIRRFRRKHQVNAMMEKIEVVPRETPDHVLKRHRPPVLDSDHLTVQDHVMVGGLPEVHDDIREEIGRASCRERV